MAAQAAAQPNAAPKKQTPMMYWVHTIICLCITFGFGLLTPFGPVTPLGMNVIGIFLGVLYGWIFIEVVWPSLMGLLSLMLIGGMKPVDVLHRSFGDPIVQMTFFIFIFCAAIEYYGLSKFVSLWFITRKFVRGKPWLFTFTFLGSIFILGGLTSASPAAIIGWAILYGVCDTCGYKKGEGYPTMMVFGIVFAAQMGMSIIPFKQAALTILGTYETASGGVGIDYGKYMLLAIIICVIVSVVFIFLGKYIFKPDMSKLVDLDVTTLDKEGNLNLNHLQKIILLFLFLLVVLLIGPSILPKDFFLTKFLRAIGNTGIVMLLVTIMGAMRVDGKPLLNFKVMSDKGVIWAVVLLLAVVQPLSWLMAQKTTGVTLFLTDIMKPIFEFSTPFTFAIIIGLVSVLLTQVMNNGAVGVAMVPVILAYCTSTGTSPDLPLIMVVMSVHLAFLTPAASASAALLHGNDWSDERAIWKTAPLVILVSWITVLLVTMIIGSAIF